MAFVFVMRVFTVFKSTNLSLSIWFFHNSRGLNYTDNLPAHHPFAPAFRFSFYGVYYSFERLVDHPESKVLPCVHRAPREKTGQTRLLMIC